LSASLPPNQKKLYQAINVKETVS